MDYTNPDVIFVLLRFWSSLRYIFPFGVRNFYLAFVYFHEGILIFDIYILLRLRLRRWIPVANFNGYLNSFSKVPIRTRTRRFENRTRDSIKTTRTRKLHAFQPCSLFDGWVITFFSPSREHFSSHFNRA